MDKKKDVANIISKYDDDTKKLYVFIAKIERENLNKVKRAEIRKSIQGAVEKVVK